MFENNKLFIWCRQLSVISSRELEGTESREPLSETSETSSAVSPGSAGFGELAAELCRFLLLKHVQLFTKSVRSSLSVKHPITAWMGRDIKKRLTCCSVIFLPTHFAASPALLCCDWLVLVTATRPCDWMLAASPALWSGPVGAQSSVPRSITVTLCAF